MKFTEIRKTIHDIFQFCWAPIILCILTYSIFYFLEPQKANIVSNKIMITFSNYSNIVDEFSSILEPFGGVVLIPIIFFILLIIVIYLIDSIIIIMDKVPPLISFIPEVYLKMFVTDEDILLFLRKYPSAKSFENAYFYAYKDKEKEDKDFRIIKFDKYYQIQNILKFLVLYSIFILIILTIKGEFSLTILLKELFLILVGSFIWFYCLIKLLIEHSLRFRDEFDTLRLELQNEYFDLLNKTINKREKTLINSFRQRKAKRWWKVEFLIINQLLIAIKNLFQKY